MSPPIIIVKGNSTTPALVHLTPKTVRFPFGCSKVNLAKTNLRVRIQLRMISEDGRNLH